MKHLFLQLKNHAVFYLAAFGAILSMAAVPPAAVYLSYLNLPVLAILFCLMVVIGGLRESGVFSVILARLLLRLGTLRQLAGVLVFTCFFVSMWVTNDVALLTFVPFTLLSMKNTASEKELAVVIVLQTIAANLGSMCTPVGNPQNLYLYFHYGLTLERFLFLLLPYTLAALVLLLVFIFFLPQRPIALSARLAARRARNLSLPASRRQLGVLGLLFFFSMLTVAHVLDYRVTLLVVCVLTAWTKPQYFRHADYWLLATFVAFFILIGNLSQLTVFRQFLVSSLAGHEFLAAVVASQVISNVPAAILLSGFTGKAEDLLLGTDIGGLGTLIASMANLISYGSFVRACPARQGYFLKAFTVLNFAYLGILVLLAAGLREVGL